MSQLVIPASPLTPQLVAALQLVALIMFFGMEAVQLHAHLLLNLAQSKMFSPPANSLVKIPNLHIGMEVAILPVLSL